VPHRRAAMTTRRLHRRASGTGSDRRVSCPTAAALPTQPTRNSVRLSRRLRRRCHRRPRTTSGFAAGSGRGASSVRGLRICARSDLAASRTPRKPSRGSRHTGARAPASCASGEIRHRGRGGSMCAPRPSDVHSSWSSRDDATALWVGNQFGLLNKKRAASFLLRRSRRHFPAYARGGRPLTSTECLNISLICRC
jgi:hypothetical protein